MYKIRGMLIDYQAGNTFLIIWHITLFTNTLKNRYTLFPELNLINYYVMVPFI